MITKRNPLYGDKPFVITPPGIVPGIVGYVPPGGTRHRERHYAIKGVATTGH